jgi:hypothetical protein
MENLKEKISMYLSSNPQWVHPPETRESYEAVKAYWQRETSVLFFTILKDLREAGEIPSEETMKNKVKPLGELGLSNILETLRYQWGNAHWHYAKGPRGIWYTMFKRAYDKAKQVLRERGELSVEFLAWEALEEGKRANKKKVIENAVKGVFA